VRKIILLISMVIVVALAITFALRNSQVVEINYYMGFIWRGQLTFLLLITFSIGMIFSALIMSISLVKHRARASRANRRALKLENQLDELKALPVDEV
jgi:lipopolysaccharide assembly protein A